MNLFKTLLMSAVLLILSAASGTEPPPGSTVAGNSSSKEESGARGARVSASSFADAFQNIYDDPDPDAKAWTRYWVSASYYTEERVDYEMKSMADAGISVVELQNSYYWCDTDYHKKVFLWILRAAKKYGLELDFAGGRSYPTTMPVTSSYYNVDNMVHKLVYGFIQVNAGETYSGVIPLPKAEPSGARGPGGPQGESSIPGAPGAPGSPGTPGEPGVPASMSQGDAPGAAGGPDAPAGGQTGVVPGAQQSGNMAGNQPGGQPGGQPFGQPGMQADVAPVPVGNAIAVVAVHVVGEDSYTSGGGFMGGRNASTYKKIDQSFDLTHLADIEKGTIDWKAPEANGGHWEIIGFWKTLSSESTIDYLSIASTEAFCMYWDNEVLYNDEVRELFKLVGRNYWEDSLESITINWTDELIREFEDLMGYAFPLEMMPTLMIQGLYSMSGSVNAPADYEMEGDVDRIFRNDFFETLSSLYNKNHLTAIQDFFKENYGMGFKCQVAYNYPLDVTSATMVVDYPEYEGLDSNDETDSYRVFAGAMHTSGKKTFSSENCARMLNFSTDVYRMKWYDMLWHIDVSYSGGNNASVFHGVEAAYDGTVWPAKGPNGPGFAEGLGPRMPYWQFMDETVDSYLARTQKVLQTGQPKMDLAIFFNWFDYGLFAGDKGWVYYTDRGLEAAGYSYDFISTASLEQDNAAVSNGMLFPDGPAYKALVINANRPYNTVLAKKGSGMIPVETAKKIVELARAGLPVLIIGEPPIKTLNYRTYNNGNGDLEVQKAMAELLELKNVVRVNNEADAVAGLARLGVYPDAQFEPETLNLFSFHRANEDTDFYFLFNRTHSFVLSGEPFPASNLNTDEAATLETVISFAGHGIPYLLDPWTGTIVPIASYTKDGDRYLIQVQLEPSDTRIIAFADRDWYDGDFSGSAHVNSNMGNAEVAYDGNDLVVRAAAAGNYDFDLENGKEVQVAVDRVPEGIDLTRWTLQIESWEPNEAYRSGDLGTDNENVYEIVKKLTDTDRDGQPDTYALDGLKPWKDIHPALQGVSGVGRYSTSLSLPADWDSSHTGYLLELGKTNELFQVSINEKNVDFNQIYPSADVTEYLQPGENVIRIEVASNIFNAVKTWNENVLNDRDREGYWESYGLMGPVKLVPYGIAKIDM